ELLRWRALAVLPGLLALGLSQAFVAQSGTTATLAGLGYAALVGGLFLASRNGSGRGFAGAAVLAVPTIILGVAAAVAVTAVDHGRQPPYSVRQQQFAAAPLPRTVSPLSQVAARLEHP